MIDHKFKISRRHDRTAADFGLKIRLWIVFYIYFAAWIRPQTIRKLTLN